MKSTPKKPKQQKSGGKSKPKSKKKKYKVRNWKEYNQELVNRGKITYWVSEEVARQWIYEVKDDEDRKPGKPTQFSNLAIETMLVFKQLYHLTLRGMEGFVTDVFTMLKLDLMVPDYSTVAKRMDTAQVVFKAITKDKVSHASGEPLHVVIDSSGAKVYGEGEWKVKKHGWSKHRTWRKFHLAINEATSEILAAEVTGNDTADSAVLPHLLNQIDQPINQVSGDGAYDKRVCYDALLSSQILKVTIPPQKNARIWQHGNSKQDRLARDENLRRIRHVGRKQWKQESNYHRRSLSETAMFRYKTIFGDRLSSRVFLRQQTEIFTNLKILNHFTKNGMPDSYLVA